MGNQAECRAARIAREFLGEAENIAAITKSCQIPDQPTMQCELEDVYFIVTVRVRRAY